MRVYATICAIIIQKGLRDHAKTHFLYYLHKEQEMKDIELFFSRMTRLNLQIQFFRLIESFVILLKATSVKRFFLLIASISMHVLRNVVR